MAGSVEGEWDLVEDTDPSPKMNTTSPPSEASDSTEADEHLLRASIYSVASLHSIPNSQNSDHLDYTAPKSDAAPEDNEIPGLLKPTEVAACSGLEPSMHPRPLEAPMETECAPGSERELLPNLNSECGNGSPLGTNRAVLKQQPQRAYPQEVHDPEWRIWLGFRTFLYTLLAVFIEWIAVQRVANADICPKNAALVWRGSLSKRDAAIDDAKLCAAALITVGIAQILDHLINVMAARAEPRGINDYIFGQRQRTIRRRKKYLARLLFVYILPLACWFKVCVHLFCPILIDHGPRARRLGLQFPTPIPFPLPEPTAAAQAGLLPPSPIAADHAPAPAAISPTSSINKQGQIHSHPQPLLPDRSQQQNLDWEDRLHRLEMQHLTTMKQLELHGTRLTSLEARVSELADILRSQSSCGAHFAESSPIMELHNLVDALDMPRRALKGRTEVIVPPGSSTEMAHAPGQQCMGQPHCSPATALEDITNANIGDEEVESDKSGFNSDIQELFKRISALEGGVESLHSVLSSARDQMDQELSAITAGMAAMEERVDELEIKATGPEPQVSVIQL